MDDQANQQHSMNRRQFLRAALLTGSAALAVSTLPSGVFAAPSQVAPAQVIGLGQVPRNQTVVTVRGGTQGKFIEDQLWRPDLNWAGIKESLKVLLTYSFEPNDWTAFHGKVPVFGSLFTLLLFCLPFLRGGRIRNCHAAWRTAAASREPCGYWSSSTQSSTRLPGVVLPAIRPKPSGALRGK